MPQIIINGRVIEQDALESVSISNDCAYVNDVIIPFDERKVEIEIRGDVSRLNSTAPVKISGSAGDVECSGSCVISGDVTGNVECYGTLICGNIGGRVDAAGTMITN